MLKEYSLMPEELVAAVLGDIEGTDVGMVALEAQKKQADFDHTLTNSPKTVDQWNELFDATYMAIKDIKQQKGKYSAKQAQNTVAKLLHEPLRRFGRDELHFKITLLKAIKDGTDFFFDNTYMSPQKVLETIGWSTDQLWKSTTWSLSKLFHFSLPEGAEIHFTDVDISPHSSLGVFKLDFRVNVAHGLKEFELKFNSFMLDWTKQLHHRIVEEMGNLEDQFGLLLLVNTHFHKTSLWYTWDNLIQVSAEESESFQFVGQNAIDNVPIYTRWQFSSLKKDCIRNSTFSGCLDSCMIFAHVQSCNCIPWHLLHTAVQGHRMCEEACHPVYELPCHKACNLCENQLIEFGLTTNDQNVINTDGLQFKIIVAQNLHHKMVEYYDYTLDTFLAELGAILDFWMGINLFAIFYAFIWVGKLCFKHIKHHQTHKAVTGNKRKMSRQEKKQRHIKATATMVKEQCSVLRQAAQSGRLVMGTEPRNRFFDETPLTGFSFITTAKSRVEVVFWYFAIVAFCLLTIQNFHSVLAHFLSQPTKVEAFVIADDGEIPIGNFSLIFGAPLVEFSTLNPTAIRYINNMRANSEKLLDDFACSLYKCCFFHAYNDLDALKIKWLGFENWDLGQPLQVEDHDSNEQNFEQWTNVIEESASNLNAFIERYKNVKSPTVKQRTNIQNELTELLDQAMEGIGDSAITLFLLDAMKSGQNPQAKLNALLKRDPSGTFDSYTNADTKKMSDLINGWSGMALWKKAQYDVSRILHVQVEGAPGTKVFLRDWTYDIADSDELLMQTITLRVQIPANVEVKGKLQIKIYSFATMWMSYIIDIFKKRYAESSAICYDKIEYDKYFALNIYASVVNWMDAQELLKDSLNQGGIVTEHWMASSIYSHVQSGLLKLRTDNGVEAQYPLFGLHNLGIQSHVKLVTDTQNCYGRGFETCIDVCESQVYMNRCGCIPWTLAYLDEQTAVCTAPCNVSQTNCKDKCQIEAMHPCQASMFDMAVQTNEDTQNDKIHFPYTITIKNTKKHGRYLKYKESRDQTFSGLVGEIGGIFDLWLGLNLLAAIHLAVHLFKLLFKCTAKKNAVSQSEPKEVTTNSQLNKIDELEKKLSSRLTEILIKLMEESMTSQT